MHYSNKDNTMPPTKLPDSTHELGSLALVLAVAVLAAGARLLYGKDDLTWRYTVGALLVAATTAVLVYGVIASYFPVVGGHASAAIGAAVGLFTDDFLKRARDGVRSFKLPNNNSNN